jgi:hypothetical protein
MAYYWLQKHQELIDKYYYGQFSGITSGTTRTQALTELLPVFEKISRLCMYSAGMPQTPENIQDTLIRICYYILPRLKAEKLQGSFQYIWLSTRNFVYNEVKKNNKKYVYDDYSSLGVEADVQDEADYPQYIEDTRTEILDHLNNLLSYQEQISSGSTSTRIKLIKLLIDYVQETQFDVAGFNIYAMKTLDISYSSYSLYMNEFGFNSKIFNEKIMPKIKEYN